MAMYGRFYFAGAAADARVDDWLAPGRGGGEVWTPTADVVDVPDGWMAWVELPGVAREDVEVVVAGERCLVRGVRRPHGGGRCLCYRQAEIRSGPFERVLTLPGPVAADGARARLADGVLELCLPRAVADDAAFVSFALRLLGH